MDRKEQIKYCEQCLHKGFDSTKGMICGLNGLIPELKDSCQDLSIDPQIEKLKNWKKENKIHPNRYSIWSAGDEGSIYDLDGKKLLIGLGFIIIGACLTIYSYLNAHPGGTYSIYWGLVLVGMFRLFNSVKEKD